MSNLYRLDMYDSSGVIQDQITNFLSLAYTKRACFPGVLNFTLSGYHSLVTALADKWQVEVWRKPEGQVWARDFVGIYRNKGEYSFGAGGSSFVVPCPGLLSMLGWRIVAWKAGVANRSQFTGQWTETIMKTLVDYNAGANATIGNGRLRAGSISGLSVQADGANGVRYDWYCQGAVLLETLQKLAPVAGGDFDLVKTGATTYEFRWYTGQLGTDRTATVKFGLGFGNMAEVSVIGGSDEATVGIVGGQGEADTRDFVIRTGPNYSASNNIEKFIEATDIEKGDTNGLNSRGDQVLDELKGRDQFLFTTQEIPETHYGVHYFLGDLVTVVNPRSGMSATRKVVSVSVALDRDGKETIEPEFATP